MQMRAMLLAHEVGAGKTVVYGAVGMERHAAADHLRASLALDALDMALRRRSPARGDAGAGVSRGSTGAWTCRVSCRSSSTRAT